MNETIVDVRGLTVRIEGKAILDDISVRLRRGECVLIAGPNGSGKSTFLKCLAGAVLPDRGSVAYGPGLSRKKVAFISDQLSLFENLTVRAALDFHDRVFGGGGIDRPRMEGFTLDDRQRVKHLSAGERTLFHLVLALSQRPELLLIDEVIHVIDPYLRDQFLETVIDLMDRLGTTVVLVNHTFSEIEKIPERVLVMGRGRFCLDERSEALAERLKKVVSPDALPEDVPRIFSREAAGVKETYVYPVTPTLRSTHPLDYRDVDLNTIIKAFIGGQYVQKGME